ncbi:MFS transporter [Amycolatopsis viridis]|uniref:EmrB/QacA subfamily drug resistance transporter n=1 Tax=Amycolatopsis viridis TaxID=185678 RepID=A0ABX0SYL8_9PSEU|nr:MFS transporter [Amycolatopsis viridis]NIH82061.1 EmrB/QacA subfamily drug resistance transporter [Amycolatopsis viridis]
MSETTLPASRTAGAATAARPRTGVALAILLTCQVMFVLDITVMNVALPRIQADLGFTPASLSWVMSSYTLVFGGLLLLGGRAGDLFGRKRLFIGGVLLFTVASFAGGLAGSAALLIAARIVQGLGAAAAGPSTLALLTTTITEPRARLRALALFAGMSSAGFAVGLILGGLLTEWLSWRAVLFINVPFGLVVAVLATRFVAEPPRHPARLDLPGAVTGTLGVAALVYGFIRAAEVGWTNGLTVAALAAGAVLIGAFLAVEARTAQPLLPLRLFRDRNRAAAYANFFFGPMIGMSMFFFLTQYLQDVRGMSALGTGFAFLPMAVLVFVLSRIIPRLLPRFGPQPIAIAGTLSMIAGLAWATQLEAGSTYAGGVLGPMILMGLGMGLAFAPLSVIIMSNVPGPDAGAAGGVMQTLQQTGSTLGLAILVTIFGTAGRAATGGPHEVMVSGMTAAFTGSIVIACLTFVVALTFRREPERTA